MEGRIGVKDLGWRVDGRRMFGSLTANLFALPSFFFLPLLMSFFLRFCAPERWHDGCELVEEPKFGSREGAVPYSPRLGL